MSQVIATFYQFVKLPDFAEKRKPILEYCQKHSIKGTVLLAKEGINGTIAGSQTAIEAAFAFLRSDLRLAHLDYRLSYADRPPFKRLKVRLKKEIVTLGIPEIDPNEQVGTYVSPQQWNDLIADPEVTVLDTRNAYEVAIGTFKGAIDPQTRSFREFPNYVRHHLDRAKHKKIAMFCTGGIRCEKASSFLLSQGFEQVYHLKGGILKYLEEISPEKSCWQGECFVFDERVALKQGLAVGSYEMCKACGYPLCESDKLSPHYQESVACPHCCDRLEES
jgi:UPF0176 protein